tara:strand:+ start:136 stop:294 length:159 start_codon:yes stop_codon:yes gene_type:complete
MNSLIIGLIMAIGFFAICINQIFNLQKEVRKLKSIVTHLMNEIKNLKDKYGR